MFLISMRAFWLLSAASLVLGNTACRCLYGEQCWPNESDFSALASQVSQPLLQPVPPESACYPTSQLSGNCAEVMNRTSNGVWRSDQAGSMQTPSFETFIFGNGTIGACYLNATLGFPCEQGSVPVIGVDAGSAQDVQAAITFASKHNLRLVVKNTGHDFLGRSTARASFLLWMHHLKNITYSESFVPAGGPSNETYKALTVDAGVQWYEAYSAAQLANRTIVGASCGTVGAAGGWVMGGGHGALSSRHGLGVDNIIQFTAVTANGDILTVNSYQNADLFWALRGGGGGTYAVVTSATYLTHDPVPMTVIFFSANFTSPVIAKRVLTEYIQLHPSLADAGWGGYAFLSVSGLSFTYLVQNISESDANKMLDAFVTFASNATGSTIQPLYATYMSFNEVFSSIFAPATNQSAGSSFEMGSRLLLREVAENDPEMVVDTLLALQTRIGLNFVAGGAVSKVDPDSTGLHPGWRKALAHLFFIDGWAEGDSSSVIEDVRKRIRAKLDILNNLGSVTYLNEASLYEKDFKETFFGTHYGKLREIKNRYDPEGLFIVASGVGSDDWDGSLNCHL